MSRLQIKKMVLSAMFLALGLVLPFLTMQIPEIGSMLLPMHIPVLLCGFVCGGWWGLAVGLICPILRSALFSMPPMFPVAVSMSFELAVYGLVTGLLYQRLPKTKVNVVATLLIAMVCGRIVWGIVRWLLTFVSATTFSWQLFLGGAVTTAIPGIVLQIILIPAIVYILESQKLVPLK